MRTLHYAEIGEHGKVLRAGTILAPSLEHIAANADGKIVRLSSPLRDCAAWRHDGVSLIPIPPRPSPHHQYDYEAQRWVVDEAQAWGAVRSLRDSLLAATDWVTLRALETGEPVPAEWQAYRQALRDITLQSDPAAIIWPAPVASMPPLGDGPA